MKNACGYKLRAPEVSTLHILYNYNIQNSVAVILYFYICHCSVEYFKLLHVIDKLSTRLKLF